MNKLLLSLSLVAFLSGCVEKEVIYLNEKGEQVPPPVKEKVIKDITNKVNEVCINGVVYYHYSYSASASVLSPKMKPHNHNIPRSKPLVFKC